MPVPKSEFDRLYPCDFYEPADLLESGRMYTVYEIARLLNGLDPDAELYEGDEEVLLDWTIPWVVFHSEDLVVAEPPAEDEPAYYGLDEGDAEEDGGARTGNADE